MCNLDRDVTNGTVHDSNTTDASEEKEKLFDTCTHPVFAELLLGMIDELPDNIVSWSVAGDSFVIKQASEKETSDEKPPAQKILVQWMYRFFCCVDRLYVRCAEWVFVTYSLPSIFGELLGHFRAVWQVVCNYRTTSLHFL